jgi:carbonic anhydrase
MVQLNHLRTYPAVTEAEERGALRLHGCYYRIESGEVTACDTSRRQFVKIDDYIQSEMIA